MTRLRPLNDADRAFRGNLPPDSRTVLGDHLDLQVLARSQRPQVFLEGVWFEIDDAKPMAGDQKHGCHSWTLPKRIGALR